MRMSSILFENERSKHLGDGRERRAGRFWPLLAVLGALGLASPAAAQMRPVQKVFTANLPGRLLTVGNSVVTCDRTRNSAADCNAVETGAGAPTLDNDTLTTAFIDVDSDASTFNSSAATLAFNGQIEWAGLYWWGSTDPEDATRTVDAAGRNTVKLQPPGGAYASVTAAWLVAGVPYLAFADVTNIVKASGPGAYQVGNVVTFAGSDDHLGGWSLVVVNRDPALPFRHVSIYDGYQTYGGGTAIDVNFTDFLTPLMGPVDAQMTFIALDGDAGKGDQVAFNGQPLVNALNPVNDFGNSTISNDGVSVTGRTPAFPNTLGTDIDTYNVSALLLNGATSAKATFSGVSSETNFAVLMGFQTTLYAPKIVATKSFVDVNGGETRPGDVLEYTVVVQNEASAQDGAVKVVLTDPIPANTNYVPGSLTLVTGSPGGAAAGALTDAAGDDTGDYDAQGRQIAVRLGQGASASAGGALAPGQSTSVRFRVTIDPNLDRDTVVSNQAKVTFEGLTISQTAGSAVITVTSNAPVTGGPTDTPVDPIDTDGDGLSDKLETTIGTDPNDADTDDDGLSDGAEPRYDQDSDMDGVINARDPDSDADGLRDGTEAGKDCSNPATNVAAGNCVPDADPATTTSPIDRDTDDGSVPDGQEDRNQNGRIDAAETDPNNPADDVGSSGTDTDNDGLPDPVEDGLGTNPNDADSDDDGVIDGQEPAFGTDSDGDGVINALDPDSDDDGILDGTELGKDCNNPATNVAAGFCVPDADGGATTTDPVKKDTDAGGKADGAEDANRNGRIDAGETDPNNPADDNALADTDGDGLTDGAETSLGSNPMDADTDDDGVIDGAEANPSVDTDGDGLINVLDPDSDDDGLFDGTEQGQNCTNPATNVAVKSCVPDADPTTTTSPVARDTDAGGKSDGAEDGNLNGRIDAGETDPNNPADDNTAPDADGDGLSDGQEGTLGSNPNDADSDDDGVIDGAEANPGDDTDGDGKLNVLDPDSDGDGLFDGTEQGKNCANPATDLTKASCVADADPTTTTSPLLPDTDAGGVSDGVEDGNRNGLIDPQERNPNNPADDQPMAPDTDGDGLPDAAEPPLGGDPNDADTDDDGLPDGAELNPGLDLDGDGLPNIRDPDSDGDGLFDGTEAGRDCMGPGTDVVKLACIPDADAGATKTDPQNADTDRGTVPDGLEDANRNGVVDVGERDPNNPADDVPGVRDGFVSGGGCNCAFGPSGGSPSGSAALLGLALGAWLWVRRRRG